MDDEKAARSDLERIQQFWIELERTEEDTPEYEILVKKIRELADNYSELTKKAKKRG